MSVKTLWGLIAVAFALLLVAIVDPWQDDAPSPRGRLLSPTLLKEISLLRVSDDSGMRELKLSDHRWSFPTKDNELVDQAEVARTISALELLAVLRVSEMNSETGLDTPRAEVFLQNLNGDSLELRVGALVAGGKFRWVQSARPDKPSGDVALVEEYLVREVLTSSKEWRSRKIVLWNFSKVQSIRFSDGENSTTLSRDEVVWGNGREISNARTLPGAFEDWRERLLRLEFVRDADGACTQEGRTFELVANGNSLHFRDCGMCSAAERYLQIGARGGCADEEIWQELLQVASNPHSLVSLSPFPLEFGGQRFEAKCDGQVIQVDPDKVDEEELLAWTKEVNGSVLGIENAQEFLPQCHLRGSFGEIRMGEGSGKWIVRDTNESIQRVLRPEIASLLRADRFHFRPMLLLSEDPLFASRITISKAGKEVVLVRGELLQTWSMIGGGNDSVATQYALPIVNALGELRAVSLEPKGDRLSGTSSFSVTIAFEHPTQGSTQEHRLTLVGNGSTCQIQVENGAVGNFDPQLCKTLLSSFSALLR